MITSVTSATATATSADAGWGIALGAGGALLVIGLLISLELLGDAPHGWQRTLRQTLKVTTAPLVIVFAISVLAKALTTLG
ncbi:MAG: hypothetical protein ACRDGB_07410 [Candidatus Limnocylindria bacterium]